MVAVHLLMGREGELDAIGTEACFVSAHACRVKDYLYHKKKNCFLSKHLFSPFYLQVQQISLLQMASSPR